MANVVKHKEKQHFQGINVIFPSRQSTLRLCRRLHPGPPPGLPKSSKNGVFFHEGFGEHFVRQNAPKWLPKWSQNPTKIDSFAQGLHFRGPWLVLAPFWLHFGCHLVPFWFHFGPFGSIFYQKSSLSVCPFRKAPAESRRAQAENRRHRYRRNRQMLAEWILVICYIVKFYLIYCSP